MKNQGPNVFITRSVMKLVLTTTYNDIDDGWVKKYIAYLKTNPDLQKAGVPDNLNVHGYAKFENDAGSTVYELITDNA